MENITSNHWSDVKNIKFHHKVKRFYYKNLFRKIYTIAIIGLIGANVFSMMKYASFAEELTGLNNVDTGAKVETTLSPVGGVLDDIDEPEETSTHNTAIPEDDTAPQTDSTNTSTETISDEQVQDDGDTESEVTLPKTKGAAKGSSLTKGTSSNPMDIVIQVEVTEPGQTLQINKYFANDYTVARDANEAPEILSSDSIHEYSTPGTKTITLSLTGGADRWEFQNICKPLVPKAGTTMTGVKIVLMPSLAEGFGESAKDPGGYFFRCFNGGHSDGGAIEKLPEGSFDTSNIEIARGYFFSHFNYGGAIEKLPEGSFNTNQITTVGDLFFESFNENGAIKKLPEGSFNVSSINASNGGCYEFFYRFNRGGAISYLPDSFTISPFGVRCNAGYVFAFEGYYRLNKKVSDLVEGITPPSRDSDVFTDIQPGRCGVHANWLDNASTACYIRVMFDTNGLTTINDIFRAPNSVISLPNIERSGYKFLGWYTLPEGGERVGGYNDNYSMVEDITLYAHWEPSPKVRFLDGDDVIVDEEEYRNWCGNTDYGYTVCELTFENLTNNSDFEEYLSQKEGLIFKGRYTDKNLTQKFDFQNMTIEGDLDLYAKWESCPEGYIVGKTMCVPMPSNDGNGYIELTYGDETVYIKDRNQGASISAQKIIEINNLKNEYNMCSSDVEVKGIVGGTKGTNNRKSGSQDGDFFGEVSDIIGADVTTCEEIDEYIDEVMPLSYGDYYYRGNNTGASRDELGVDNSDPRNMRANVSQQAIDRGFDGGHLGESEGKGWIEGNTHANPCNAEDGEYLPTVDDWKKAMEIWSETKGYDLDIEDYDDNGYNYGYIYYDSEFMNDILAPNAGYIKYDSEPLTYNKQDKVNKMNLLALLFANPVMAEYQGYRQYISYIQNSYPYLWSAVDSGHKFGSFEGGDQYYYENIDINEYDYGINDKAAPVRCFIDPDHINSVEKYTVTFDTKGGNEAVPAQTVKEGKELKEPATPTRDNYTFDGWYRSNGTKWIFDTDTVQSEMTLYAKWRLCGEGFVVENNKCIPEGMELNGVIKVTDGSETMYIRDRNVGVTSDAAVNLLKLDKIDIELDNRCDNQCSDKNDYDKCYNECYGSGFSKKIKEELGTSYENIDDAYNSLQLEVLKGVLPKKEMEAFTLNMRAYEIFAQCEGEDDACGHDELIAYVNTAFELESKLQKWDDLMNWLNKYFGEDDFDEFNEKYRNGYYWNLIDVQSYGNYYYRGNNNGVNYNDLIIDRNNGSITNIDGLLASGFDGGKIGVEGQGWIEGNLNPCDPEKGEYLPTPEDGENLMQIWGNSRGYHMESANNQGINVIRISDDDGNNMQDEFESNMLIPLAGDIAGERFVNGTALWSAQNEGNNLGYYNNGLFYYGNKSISEEIGGNTYAMPVRCFVNPAEIPDVYVVSYETNGGNEISDVNVIGGDTVILPTPSKANYTFGGWYTDKALTKVFEPSTSVTSDLTLYAKWTTQQASTPTNGYSGGGGGGKVTKPNTNKNDHGSAETPKSEVTAPIEGGEKNESSDGTKGSTFSKPVGAGSNKVVLDMESYNPSYSFEQNQAYQFAKSYGITTQSTIQDANVNGNLTRIEMAKMLSQYSVNILGKEPDLSNGTVKFADVPQSLDKKYDNGVSVAYLLGIMGQNMKDNRFRPYDEVTRGEFVTAFSRMIYNTSDGKYKSTPEYYTNHINKLSLEKIITKINPKMKELRGYVMLMLYRSVK